MTLNKEIIRIEVECDMCCSLRHLLMDTFTMWSKLGPRLLIFTALTRMEIPKPLFLFILIHVSSNFDVPCSCLKILFLYVYLLKLSILKIGRMFCRIVCKYFKWQVYPVWQTYREEESWWLFPVLLLLVKSVQARMIDFHIANLEIQDRTLYSDDPTKFWDTWSPASRWSSCLKLTSRL